MPEKKLEELREKFIKEAREKIKVAYAAKDKHIIKAVSVLEALDEIFNLMAEHAIEWYAMHFPELTKLAKENEVFLNCILLGERKEYQEASLLKFYQNEERVKRILEAREKSMGSPLAKEDLEQIQSLARNALQLRSQRSELVNYLEKGMKELAPNFTQLCGANLGAKMLAQAGSLEKLALLPSSTIQLLGAEKALFRHIRSGVKPPKHGFLFQHPLVKGLKASLKGKMARTLAGKLSIAAREDFFGKKDIAGDLQKDLEQRAKELKAK